MLYDVVSTIKLLITKKKKKKDSLFIVHGKLATVEIRARLTINNVTVLEPGFP